MRLQQMDTGTSVLADESGFRIGEVDRVHLVCGTGRGMENFRPAPVRRVPPPQFRTAGDVEEGTTTVRRDRTRPTGGWRSGDKRVPALTVVGRDGESIGGGGVTSK